MKNKIILFVSFLLLTGCWQEAKMEMASIAGVQMEPLKLDPNTGGSSGGGGGGGNPHVMSGACPASLSGFELSFDHGDWNKVELESFGMADATKSETQVAVTDWDTNCSDGKFKFWIYDSAIGRIAGGMPTSVLLRGYSGMLTTEASELMDGDGGSSGGGTFGTPAGFAIHQEMGTSGYAAGGECIKMVVYLTDANGNYGSVTGQMSVKVKAPGVQAGGIYTAFDSNAYSDCTTNVVSNGYDGDGFTSQINLTTFNSSYGPLSRLEFWYFMPASLPGAVLDQNVEVQFGSALDYTGLAGDMFTVNLISSTTAKLSGFNMPSKVVQDVCYPLNLNIHEFSYSHVGLSRTAVFRLTDSSRVKLYTNSSCDTVATSGGVEGIATSSNSSVSTFFKVSGVTSSENGARIFVEAFDAVNPTIKLADANLIIPLEHWVDVDKSGDGVISTLKLELMSMGPVQTATCQIVRVTAVNSNLTPLPVFGVPVQFKLSAVTGTNNGNFFSNSTDCTNGSSSLDFVNSTANIPDAYLYKEVYYKPSFSGEVDLSGFDITRGGSTLTSAAFTFNVSP